MCTEAPPLRVTLDVVDLEPIAGRLRCGSAEVGFIGWMEFTRALEVSLRAARDARVTTETSDGEAGG